MAEASVSTNGQMACVTKKLLLEGTLSLDSPLGGGHPHFHL